MRLAYAFCALLLLIPSGFSQTGWRLAWSDEFDGLSNSPPDASRWTFDLGGGGWGNKELETYSNEPENVHVDGNGNLVIRAVRTSSGGYTSARLKTRGRFSFAYGKIEARIKIPSGQGIWPAFWMLGDDIDKAGWPACGEVDIMENIGREPSIVHGSLHGPGYSGGNSITAAYKLSGGQRFADDFHTFGIEWAEGSVEFFVDSQSYFKVTPARLPAGARWSFNKPFFLLLNLAVGGKWPGDPDSTTQFPQETLVDYVRVYQKVVPR